MENHLNTNKIPTAEEWLNKHALECIEKNCADINELKCIMIHFAREHVEAAKKEYLQQGFGRYMEHPFDKYPTRVPTDEDSILNAYPLENVK